MIGIQIHEILNQCLEKDYENDKLSVLRGNCSQKLPLGYGPFDR